MKEVKLEKLSSNMTALENFVHIFRLSLLVTMISFRGDGMSKCTQFIISFQQKYIFFEHLQAKKNILKTDLKFYQLRT